MNIQSIYLLALRCKNSNLPKLLVLLLVVVLGNLAYIAPAMAEPRDVDGVQSYCRKVITGKAQQGCNDIENINHARNKSQNNGKCDEDAKAGADKASDCVEKAAKGFFDQLKAKKPSDKKDFVNKLEDILKKGPGSYTKQNPDYKISREEETTVCDSTNGLCADCTGQADGGCLDCNGDKCVDIAADPDAPCDNNSCDFIKKYVNPSIDLLTLLVGLMAAASIIFGGIQYSASNGDPQKVSKAKGRIFNTIYALIAYLFLYSFLQFLVPGGIFNRS